MYFAKTREINRALDTTGSFALKFRNNNNNLKNVKLTELNEPWFKLYFKNKLLTAKCTYRFAVEYANKYNMNLISKDKNILIIEEYNNTHTIIINGFISKGVDSSVYNISSIDGKDANNYFVIKIIDLYKHGNPSENKNPVLDKMRLASHKCIEKTLAYFVCNGDLYSFIIVEKLDIQLSDMSGKFNRKQINLIAQQLISALEYLHTKMNIAHCDIKENNVMYSKSSRVFKLIDFNNACTQDEFGKFELNVTLLKQSLRLFKNGYDWDYHVDVWALGATLYSVLYNKDLLREYSGYNEYKNIKDELRRQFIFNAKIVNFWENRIQQMDHFFKPFFYCSNVCELNQNIKYYQE
jgi:serine/threonine protein kinase